MANEADIAVRVGADITGLVSGLRKGATEVQSFGDKASEFSGKVAKIGAAATVAGLAITGYLVKASMEAVDAQAALAAQLNTTSTSMANITRAADLVGVSQGAITSASKKLTTNLSEAASGSGATAEALDRLHLSASQLQAMPLDQRIMAINSAIDQFIPAADQAAVAADLFGTKASLAIRQIDTDSLELATREIKAFGLDISEIDATAISSANDAMSRFGMLTDGASQKLATELAPRLQALGDMLLDNTEAAGGFGNEVQFAADVAVRSVMLLADGLHGVKVAGGTIKSALSEAFYTASAAMASFSAAGDRFMAKWIAQTEKHSGILIGKAVESEKAAKEYTDSALAMQEELANRLAEPLPSATWDEYTKKAREAARVTKEVTQQTDVGQSKKEIDQGKDAEKLSALAKSEDDKTALLLQKEAEREAAKKAKELESVNDRLNTVRDSLKTEETLLNESYAKKHVMLDEALAANQLTRKEYDLLDEELTNQHLAVNGDAEREASDAKKALKAAEHQALMSSSANALSAIGNLLATGNKKQFEESKKLGLAAAAISMYQGIAAGVKLGWPAAVPAVAYATATGLSAIQNIRNQKYGSAPSGGTSGGAPTLPTDTNVAGNAGSTSQQNIFVKGINPNQFFSGQQLLDIINGAAANGGVLRV